MKFLSGEFKNGKKDGKGELKKSNGDRYTGQFSQDMIHGMKVGGISGVT